MWPCCTAVATVQSQYVQSHYVDMALQHDVASQGSQQWPQGGGGGGKSV